VPASERASPQDKTITDLEWPLLLDRIAERAGSEVGAARLRGLEPATTLEEAERRHRLTASALEVAEAETPVPAVPVPELEELITRLEHGGDASALELRDLGRLLDSAYTLRAFAAARREAHPSLADALWSDPALERLRAEVARSIEPDGGVSDAASPALRDARKRVTELRRAVTGRLAQLIRRHADLLSGDYYAERDGRYVLPVRSDAHVRVEGIVLGSSASGATLYVEPQELTGLGNQLKVAEAAVEREQARVLSALSALAREHAAAARTAFGAAAQADVLVAIVRWAAETHSIAIAPDRERRVVLSGVRHPLLIGVTEVVPNDLELAGGCALVISGPNAGGKTVALKCLGLAAWMVRAGLPIPAEARSQIGWFEPVLAEVGDDQSLTRSLSTFSAHVENLAAILELAGQSALVLLDEVAAGTDPEEGSALATAVLEALVARGAAVAVTTHYERLKELAAEQSAFVNASVGFDLERMEPNFRLRIGVPGPSSALAVARRHGMPHAVLERAVELLPASSIDREEIVRALETERSLLERARRDAEQQAARQRELTEQIEEQRANVRDRERAKLADEARELVADVRRARAELREGMARLRQSGADQKLARELERTISEAARPVAIGGRLAELTARDEGPARRRPRPEELVPGARVWVPKLGASAELVELLGRDQVRVLAGSLKLVVAASELQMDPDAPRPAAPPRRRPAREKLAMADAFVPVRTSQNTLDLRGLRVEEALEKVDAFVDRLLAEGERGGFVLHGHGTGALKAAVREQLSGSTQIARSGPADPEDGGDAFTIFWLRC
jgi:DNA mismatch repair protein MutS2